MRRGIGLLSIFDRLLPCFQAVFKCELGVEGKGVRGHSYLKCAVEVEQGKDSRMQKNTKSFIEGPVCLQNSTWIHLSAKAIFSRAPLG